MATTEETRPESGSSEGSSSAKFIDVALIAAAISVLLSLYEFYVRENELRGIFVGHWAPTILAVATYLRGRRSDD